MSRSRWKDTTKRRRNVEYWSARPVSKCKPSRYNKTRTHRLERRAAKILPAD